MWKFIEKYSYPERLGLMSHTSVLGKSSSVKLRLTTVLGEETENFTPFLPGLLVCIWSWPGEGGLWRGPVGGWLSCQAHNTVPLHDGGHRAVCIAAHYSLSLICLSPRFNLFFSSFILTFILILFRCVLAVVLKTGQFFVQLCGHFAVDVY